MSLSDDDQALSAFIAASDARVTQDQGVEHSDAAVPSNVPLTTEELSIHTTDSSSTAMLKNVDAEKLSSPSIEQVANVTHDTTPPTHEQESDTMPESAATNREDTDDSTSSGAQDTTEAVETALVVYTPVDEKASDQPVDTASVPYRSRHARSYAESAYISPRLRRQMSRYVRRSLRQRRRSSLHQALPTLLLGLLFFGIWTPLILTANYAINAYRTYNSLRTDATDGIQNLLAVKSLLTTKQSNADTTTLLDSSKLQRATINLSAAHSDFTRIQLLLKQDTLIQNIGEFLPQFQPQISAGRAASQIGIDITNIGQNLIMVGQTLVPRLHGPLLGSSTTPLLTTTDLTLFSTTLEHIQPELADIQTQSRLLDLNGLPLSTQQHEQIQQYLQLLPQTVTALQLARTLIAPIGWLLGIGQPRTFLVQTMDRSELRPTGGFTGDYGELNINGGRLAPFSLKNIGLLEYTDTSVTYGQSAPAPYTWWPIANWGLRDSNLSTDFPTSAQISINEYQHEANHQVDGVIMFSSLLITYVLQVIGPVTVPLYHETITAQNLEERLHFYQDSGQGMSIEKEIEHLTDNEQARKMFTSRLVNTIMDQVRHAAPSELLALGKEMLLELQSKDLQVYATNPQLETLLKQYNYAALMDRSTTHDGLAIVQANVSASKASTDVRTTMHDTVSLDTSGGATHILQMRLDYTQVYPVYGLDTYRDYVRIYVPPDAQFLWGTGFDSGQPLCGGPLAACPDDGVYSNGALVCPNGLYDAGASTSMLNDPYAGQFHPLDQIGPPPNQQSDETGRAMFGGFVVVPKNCSMTVTLSWYVPAIVHGTYELLIQRQSGTYPNLNLTVSPPSGDCKGLYYDGVLSQDATFSLKLAQNAHPKLTSCIPQMQP